jgi:hypothetical protein
MRPYYKYIMPIVVVKLSMLFIISCNADDYEQKDETMQFYVDTSLLSTSIYLEDSNISLRPPLGWDAISDIEFEQLSKSIQNGDNIFDIRLNRVFKSVDGALMIISQVQSKLYNFGYVPPDYVDLLSEQFNIENIPTLKFPINKIPIIQYLINTDDFVIIRFFIGSNISYQIDYIIPRNIYEKELKKIESSIGSINKQKEKK